MTTRDTGLRPAENEKPPSLAAHLISFFMFAAFSPLIAAFVLPIVTMVLASLGWLDRSYIFTYQDLYIGLKHGGLLVIYTFCWLPALATGAIFCWLRWKNRPRHSIFSITILFGFATFFAYWETFFAAMDTAVRLSVMFGISIGLAGAIAAAGCQLSIFLPRMFRARQRRAA